MLMKRNYNTGKGRNISTKNEARELIQLAPSRVILVCKVKNEKMVNINEIIFYLKSQYSAHNPQ